MPDHLDQVVTDDPTAVSGLTDGYIYHVQHSQESFRGRPSPPPILFFSLPDSDDLETTTKRPFAMPLYGTAIFKPISGRTIYVWVAEAGGEALLVMATEDG